MPIIVLRCVAFRNAISSTDRPFEDFLPVLLTSIHVNSGLAISCIPFLKPILEGTQNGILQSNFRFPGTSSALNSKSSGTVRRTNRSTDTVELDQYGAHIGSQKVDVMESEDKLVIQATKEVQIHYSYSNTPSGFDEWNTTRVAQCGPH